MNLKNLLLAAVSAVLMLALAEGALRLLDIPKVKVEGWKWDESPYRSPANASDVQVNQLGLRGANIEYGKDDFVVVLVGDSQVEAGTQPADKMPEVLLRQALEERMGTRKVKVFSVAGAGWGSDQELVWLGRYFENHRADMVVTWLTPVNDYWENTFIERGVTPQAGRLKPTFQVDGRGKLVRAQPGSRSHLRNVVSLALGRAINGRGYTLEQRYLDGWQAGLPSPDRPLATPGECPAQEIDQKVLIGAFMKGSRAYTLETDEDLPHGRSHFAVFTRNLSARDRYAIDITHRLLEETSRLATAHGARHLLYHAYRHDLDGAFSEIRCVKTLDGRLYAFDGSDWLRYLEASSLAPQLVTTRITADHALASGPNDWHLNEEGNRKAMNGLAEAIVAKGGLVHAQRPSTNEAARPGSKP